jgi:hypothetical protein
MNAKIKIIYNNREFLVRYPLTYEDLQNEFLDQLVEEEDINKQYIFYILDENNGKIILTQINYFRLKLNLIEEDDPKIFVSAGNDNPLFQNDNLLFENDNPLFENDNSDFFGDVGGLQSNCNFIKEINKISKIINPIIINNKINDSIDDSKDEIINFDEDINFNLDENITKYDGDIIDKCFYEINLEIKKSGNNNELINNENIKKIISKIKGEFNMKEEEIKQKEEKINDLFEVIEKLQNDIINYEKKLKSNNNIIEENEKLKNQIKEFNNNIIEGNEKLKIQKKEFNSKKKEDIKEKKELKGKNFKLIEQLKLSKELNKKNEKEKDLLNEKIQKLQEENKKLKNINNTNKKLQIKYKDTLISHLSQKFESLLSIEMKEYKTKLLSTVQDFKKKNQIKI